MTGIGKVHPLQRPAVRTARRTLLVRDLDLDCAIGIHAHERGRTQRVRIGIEMDMADPDAAPGDDIAAVVSYDDVIAGVRAIAGEGHINLVETLAERIADLCLADRRVRVTRVRVEKLDVLPGGASAGVEIVRGEAE